MGVKSYASSAAGNTTISGINIAENCPVANLNDADRQLMADVRNEVAAFGASTLTAASTVTLDAEGAAQNLDGTTTVTGFATATAGVLRVVHFATATPVVHSSTLSLPGSADITSAAGDVAKFRSKGGSLGWKCEGWTRQSGAPIGSIAVGNVPNDLITYAKIQNVSAASRLLGRGSAGGAGDVEEITLGTGLSMSTTTLSATTKIAQVVRDSSATYDAATTDLPLDNSIPQNTEGDEILSVAITPTNASSTIRIRVSAFVGASSVGQGGMALFVGSTANALAATAFSVAGTGSYANPQIEYTESAGSTSARTYRVRIGPDVGGPVSIRVNGDSATRIFGGVAQATLEVEEILP